MRTIRTLVGLSLLATACGDGDSRPVVHEKPPPPADAFENWDTLPRLGSRTFRAFTSFDRDEASTSALAQPGNKDFNNFAAVCGDVPTMLEQRTDGTATCEPGESGYVLAAVEGPGVVSRLWLTGAFITTGALEMAFTDERIRVYVDDEAEPLVDAALSDLGAGLVPPFVPPLAGSDSGSFASYVPIHYTSSLRVVADGLHELALFYYEVDVVSESEGEPPAFSGALLSDFSAPDAAARLESEARDTRYSTAWVDESFAVGPGSPTVLDRDGPGTLRTLRLTLPASQPVLEGTSLRVTWDDEATPAIDVPLVALLGAWDGEHEFDTLPMSVKKVGDELEWTLALPMPFRHHARIELATEADPSTIGVRASGTEGVPEGDLGTLRAELTEQEPPFPETGLFDAFVGEGPGKYVGTLMYGSGVPDPEFVGPAPVNFLEGDARMVIDGETVLSGTGTEDFFDGGWYFKEGTFSAPFSALISLEAGEAETGRATMLRWHLLNGAVDYRDSMSLGFEYGANRPEIVRSIGALSFYYSKARD